MTAPAAISPATMVHAAIFPATTEFAASSFAVTAPANIFAVVILPAAISFAVTAFAAIFPATTAPARIFGEVIESSRILVLVTAFAAMSELSIARSAIFAVLIAPLSTFNEVIALSTICVVSTVFGLRYPVIADIAARSVFAALTAPFAISAFTIKGDGPFPPKTLSVTFPVISAFGNHVATRSPPFWIAIAASVVVCIAVGMSSCQ